MSFINIRYFKKENEQEKESKKVSITAHSYPYILTTYGHWDMIVSREKKKVSKGNTVMIRIKPIEVGPEELVLPCFINRHAYGVPISIGSMGPPKKIEEKRMQTYVTFIATDDGQIEENDLLGLVNILRTAIRVNALATIILKVRHVLTHLFMQKSK